MASNKIVGYSITMAAKVCGLIAAGMSVKSLCEEKGMPTRSTIFVWLAKHDEFKEMYKIATEQRTMAMFEEMLEIADNSEKDHVVLTDDEGKEQVRYVPEAVRRADLRIKTRQWHLGRMMPQKYGDRIQQDVNIVDTAGLLEKRNAAKEKMMLEDAAKRKALANGS